MNPNMDIKKPLLARKTMTPSSRKQVKMLNKMKYAQGAEKTANDASSEDNHVHQKIVETNCLHPSSLEQLDCSPESKPTQLSPRTLNKPLANLVLNSEISIYNDHREMSKDHPYNTCTTNSDVKQIWNAGALQDILYSWYEKESNSPIVKPVEVHLNLEPNSQLLRNSEEQFSVTSPTNAIPALDRVMETTEETLVNQTIPILEREDGNVQLHKKMVNSSVQTDDSLRKRRVSESSEDALSKRIKSSGKECDTSLDKRQSGLGKVRSFIQNRMDTSMGKLDHQLQHLHERIDRTQCLRKHEGIAIKIVKRISRLDRRINAVITFQNAGLSKKVKCPGADSQNKILNCTTPLPGDANVKATPSNTSEALSKGTETFDDIVCIDLVNKNSGVEAVNATDVQQKGSSVKTNTPAEMPCNSKNLLLIDLTDEESSVDKVGGEKERKIAERRHSAPEVLIPDPPQSALQLSKEVPKEFSHLPPLPRTPSQPEHVNGFWNTLPPQKLELAVAHVQNPKSIALQWNITTVEPRCAPIDSFHLFICVEGPKGSVSCDWMKMTKIKAFPLPMACSLSRFPGPTRCYFTMRSKDIYGRYGPFCDIQSISSL
ncbi:activating transcription factor 7-interacting protein 2 [Elgaria multicarinata webbii]|uniref:activating transcription factor 7-interacting protein 2 n=1 Tax=Elgaria multicarinata webbii TaxID=159646 RepID=UPI002FCD312E